MGNYTLNDAALDKRFQFGGGCNTLGRWNGSQDNWEYTVGCLIIDLDAVDLTVEGKKLIKNVLSKLLNFNNK